MRLQLIPSYKAEFDRFNKKCNLKSKAAELKKKVKYMQ